MMPTLGDAYLKRWMYPQLWKDVVGAWCPGLGCQGSAVLDWSGRGFNGSFVNNSISTQWAINQGRYAIHNDGTSAQYVNCGANSALVNGRSKAGLGGWVYKPSGSSNFCFGWSDNNGFRFEVLGLAGTTYFVGENSTAYQSIADSASGWVRYGLEFSGASSRMWINGVNVLSGALATTLGTTGSFKIGYEATSAISSANGVLYDDIVVSQSNQLFEKIRYSIGRGGAYTQRSRSFFSYYLPSASNVLSRYYYDQIFGAAG